MPARTGMVDLGTALELLLPPTGAPPGAEEVPLASALGRVLARDVTAAAPVPAAPRAAMDGFAVPAGAGGELILGGVVLAGAIPPPLLPGHTLFVATGAPLPPGADAVVPREQAAWDRSDGAGQPLPGARVRLRGGAPAGSHVMPPGEWVPAGGPVLRAGTRLGPAAVALLGTLGLRHAPVHRRPRVAILATGDELIPPGEALPPGGMYESNGTLLQAACAAAGAEPLLLPPAPDRLPELAAALRGALEAGPDVVLTTGGVSVGPADLVPRAWRALGASELFWRVAMKPGKPVYAACLGSTIALGLSGSPAACWTAFTVLAGPLLRRLGGWAQPFPAARRARLAAPLPPNPGVPRLLWSSLGPDGTVRPPERHGPGVLVAMAAADALLLQGAGTGALPAGAPVWVLEPGRGGEAGEGDPRALLAAAGRPGALAAAGGAHPVAVCGVGGWSGHGKTTLIERLIPLLQAAGEPVATLKHDGHGTPAGPPGKDGTRHRAAGARLTVVAGRGGTLCSEAVAGETDAGALLQRVRERAAAAGCRWLLVEGYHDLRIPRIEVWDVSRAEGPRCDPAGGLFLLAASDPARIRGPAGVAVTSRDAVAEIAAAMRARCLVPRGAAP